MQISTLRFANIQKCTRKNNSQLTDAIDGIRLGQDHEGANVRGQNASEQNVAQLSSRGHDDWGPIEEDEHEDDVEGKDDAGSG